VISWPEGHSSSPVFRGLFVLKGFSKVIVLAVGVLAFWPACRTHLLDRCNQNRLKCGVHKPDLLP